MSRSDLAARTLSAVSWSYAGAVLRVFAQMLVQLFLARFLGPEAFGQATAAFFVLALGWLLAEGGFGAALIQKAELQDRDVGFALGWVLLLSIGGGLLVIAFSTQLARLLGGVQLAPLIMASGALIPVQALSNIPSSLMRRNLDVKRSQLIYLGGYIVAYVGVGLPMAWSGAGAWSLIAAFGVHSVINLSACYAVTRHTLRPRLFGDPALRRFGLHVTGINVANWSIENLDRLIVNRFWGASALGEYTAAFTLSRAPANFLVSSIESVALASASRMQEDRAGLAIGYLAMLNLATLITCPLFMLLAVNSDTVIQIVYGHKWTQAGPLFAAFCVGLPFFAILAISGPLLWAVNGVRQEMVIQVVGAAIIFVGFLALTGRPLTQAVWLIPVVYLLRAAGVYLALKAKVPFRHRHALRATCPGLTVGLIAVACSMVALHWMGDRTSLVLASIATLAMALAAVVLWPRAFIAPELSTVLRNRAGHSRFIARLCRPLGLTHA